jgi:hypothetical protein
MVFLSLPALPVSAMAESPVDYCLYAGSDYDGDGWGWEQTSRGHDRVPSFRSCKVESGALQAPEFVNLQTGEAVDLIRPYWNAYRDFEGRSIKCEYYIYNADHGYEKRLNFFYSNGFVHWADQSFTTEHMPLRADFPWTGFAENFAYNGSRVEQVSYANPLTYWTVNDGIYFSNAGNKQDGREHVLSGVRYIELISDQNGAIRVWNYKDRYGSNGYAECFDISGNRFQPTGSQGEARPAAQPIESPLLATAKEPLSTAGIVNQETGTSVSLKEVRWNLTALFDETFTCQSYHWTDDSGFYPNADNNGWGYSTAISGLTAYYQPNRHTVLYAPDYRTGGTSQSAGGRYSDYEEFSGNGNDGTWAVANGEITAGPMSRYRYAETVAGNLRFWKSSNAYDVCSGIPSSAYELRAVNNTTCVDPDGDGWGWDGVRSCRVDVVAPVTVNPATCVDTDGDGWGWDGVRSCRIESTVPVTAACVDTDGDGWGWDGERSCKVETTQPQTAACIDNDGDGWGWNGVASCRVAG